MHLSKGFTIVELLTVIVVIGILASITVVAYRGIQEDAYDSSVRNDLQNLGKQFEMFALRSSNATYPDSVADLESIDGVKVDKEAYLTTGTTSLNLVSCYNSSSTRYSITAVSKSGNRFYITDKSGVQQYEGSVDWSGSDGDIRMCSSTLPGSSHVSGGSGYGSGWRNWTNG